MIFLILAIQVLWYLSAKMDAKEEVAWSYPYRTFTWPDGAIDQLPEQSYRAHKFGAFSVSILWFMTAAIFTAIFVNQVNRIELAIIFFGTFGACALMYWYSFDINYATGINKDKYYLGAQKTDQWLLEVLGPKAGKRKALYCLILSGVIDVILILLFYIN